MATVQVRFSPSTLQLYPQLCDPQVVPHQRRISLRTQCHQVGCSSYLPRTRLFAPYPVLLLQRTPVSAVQRQGLNGGVRAANGPTDVESAIPLDLTEENVAAVLTDARTELLQLFDTSVGITGIAELADLDGPYVTIRLKGRFWHERSLVLARLKFYLMQRIPEIADVTIESVAQLDDSPANF